MREGESFEDEAIKEELIKKAERNLSRVGLGWEDLEEKTILDIGAGAGELETGIRIKGTNAKIISIDRSMFWMEHKQKAPPPGFVLGDLKQLPLANESLDLILSFGGPPTVAKTEKAAIWQMEEMERVLQQKGEARITGTQLGFILKREIENGGTVGSKDFHQRVHDLSLEYLLERGYNVKEITAEDSRDSYWIVRKPEKKEEEPQS